MADVTLKALNPDMKKVVVEGKYEYEVKDGHVSVHPAHEEHVRAAGFVSPTDSSPEAPKAPEKQAEQAPGEVQDELSKLGMDELGKLLADAGKTPEEVAALKSKKDRREAIRTLKAPEAKDPLS